MEAKVDSQKRPRGKASKKIIKISLGLFIGLFVFVFFVIPAALSSNKGRQIVLSKINNAVDGQTDFSDLSVGWLKGIKIADLSFNDNAGQISFKVKSFSTKPRYGSILAGNLNFGQTNIEMPQIEINIKDMPQTTKDVEVEPKSTPTKAAGIALVTDIRVSDGNIKVTGTDSKTVELLQINSNVNLRPAGQQSNFDLNMIVAANDKESPIEANGRITPVKTKKKSGWTIKGADGDLNVSISDLDIESLEPFFALAGTDLKAKGNISAELEGQLVNGQLENLTGTATGSNLDITTAALQGDSIKSEVLDADVKLTRKDQMISIDNLNVKTDWAEVDASGSLPTSISSLDDLLASDSNSDLNAAFNCDLAEIVSQMPKTLGLRETATISSGRIQGDISTSDSGSKKEITAVAQLADLKGMVEGKEIALSEPVMMQARVSPEKDSIYVNQLELSSSFADIACSGSIESIKYNAQTDLTKLQSELGQFVNLGQYQIAGSFGSIGTVSLGQEKISASGSVEIANLNLSSEEKGEVSEPKANMDFNLIYDKENSILSTDSLQANTSFGRISVTEAIVPLKKDSTESLNATILANNLDLEKLRPFAIMFASMPEELGLAGIADSKISINSEQQTYKIKTDSTIIENLKVTYPEKKPFDANHVLLAFDTELKPQEESIIVNMFALDSPHIKVTKGEFKQYTKDDMVNLEGQAELEYNLAAISTVAAPYLPEGLSLEGKRKSSVTFSSEAPAGQKDKLLANLNAQADVGFQQANYMGLNFGQTDIGIKVENGLLEIAPFSTIVNEGQLNFAANADFKKQPTIFNTGKPMQIVRDIKINDETTKKLLKYLNPIFAEASNVSGIANLNCEKLNIPLNSAAKNETEIVGTVSLTQLRMETSGFLAQFFSFFGGGIRGTTITIHPTRFVLRDGFLKYDSMKMDIGDNPVNFEGAIGLDKSLNMSVTLPYTLDGRTIRIDEQSNRRIPLLITGTVDKPILNFDINKLLENEVENQIENLLKEGLESIFR